MKVTKVIDIITKDDQESFEIESLRGTDAPSAYHINYKNYGFAKFQIDDKSLAFFEKNLSKIEDSMSRKQIFNIMYDMLKQNDISGAQLLNICKTQLVGETSVDVMTDVMRFVIPVVIKNYIPPEIYLKSHHDIFELFLAILGSGTITDKATQHLVLDAILSSARNEDHIALLVNWFKDDVVTDEKGQKYEQLEISKKQKHTIVQRIWSSEDIPLEQKEEIMTQLAKIDSSDWLDNTKKVCDSSHPGNKKKLWDLYFSEDTEVETKDWGLINFQNSFRGWN